MKKRVVDRVVLIPREKKADLLKYFPKASLPPHLGGSNTSISVSADAVTKCGRSTELRKHGAHLVGCEPLQVSSTRMTWCTVRGGR